MEDTERITYAVAFKATVELVAAGVVEPETDDVVAEVIDLTDAFFEALAVKTGIGEEAAPKEKRSRARTSSRKPSTRSSRRDSDRGGSTSESKGPKDPNADASPKQIGAIKNKLKKAGIEFDDDGFDYDGEEIFFDELTMGSVQRFFDEL